MMNNAVSCFEFSFVLLGSYDASYVNWSFEEKTFVKQSMISEWEKCAQKVCFAVTTLHFGGGGLGKA